MMIPVTYHSLLQVKESLNYLEEGSGIFLPHRSLMPTPAQILADARLGYVRFLPCTCGSLEFLSNVYKSVNYT